jgi:hypothetical protein
MILNGSRAGAARLFHVSSARRYEPRAHGAL